jgi:Family of unknown function (DUF5317)
MILGLAYLLCLLSVPLAGGRLSRLADVKLRAPGLAGAAIAIQVVIVSILPGSIGALGEPLHMASYLLLGVFAFLNRRLAGLPIIAVGGLSNFICITINGGVMPADPDALRAIGRSPGSDEFINSTALAHPRLAFLGDIIATPASWPVSNVYSVGDLLILGGAFILLHAACGSRLVPRRFRVRPAADIAPAEVAA